MHYPPHLLAHLLIDSPISVVSSSGPCATREKEICCMGPFCCRRRGARLGEDSQRNIHHCTNENSNTEARVTSTLITGLAHSMIIAPNTSSASGGSWREAVWDRMQRGLYT